MENKHRRWRRWKVTEQELSEGILPISIGGGYDGARVLTRLHGRPVGWLVLPRPPGTELSEAQIREELSRELAWELLPGLLDGAAPPPPAADADPAVPFSVVVCPQGRHRELAQCLQALRALDYAEYEIVVVDSTPLPDDMARLASKGSVRWVREDRPGLGWARNRGIAAARHDLIAFAGEDTRPDRQWLRALADAFAEPEVMAVTGLVAPAELETEAQVLFELGCGGLGRGLRRQVFRQAMLRKPSLLGADQFGSGANMAFRRELFAAVGFFDEALDAGTPSLGGGDIEIFHRVVAGGNTLVYEPAALVWRTHPRELSALRREIHAGGCGFGAYLLTCARRRSVSRRALLRFALRTWLAGSFLRRLARSGRYPRRLLAAELAGALRSPLAYGAAQAHARRTAAAFREEIAGEALRGGLAPDPSAPVRP